MSGSLSGKIIGFVGLVVISHDRGQGWDLTRGQAVIDPRAAELADDDNSINEAPLG